MKRSYKDYLNEFEVDNKIETFKEDVMKSKEFTNAFLDLTDEQDYDDKNSLFESLMKSIEEVCKKNLK